MIPNVSIDAQVPATFGGLAKRLGFEPAVLLWHLAADLLTRPPEKLNVVMVHHRRREPKNVIPFPGGEEVL